MMLLGHGLLSTVELAALAARTLEEQSPVSQIFQETLGERLLEDPEIDAAFHALIEEERTLKTMIDSTFEGEITEHSIETLAPGSALHPQRSIAFESTFVSLHKKSKDKRSASEQVQNAEPLAASLTEEVAPLLNIPQFHRPRLDSLRYEVRERLGIGGMSEVSRLWDRSLNRDLALKTLRRELCDETLIARFQLEAEVSATLNHQNILPLFDLLEDEEGRPCYTMRVAEHQSLERRCAEEKLPLYEICRILIQVASAIESAHQIGVIHRDLKTSNILLGAHREVYVIDWGICFLTPKHPAYQKQPAEGVSLAGTPSCMSPEQARCQLENIGPRPDVYGLGAVLFHALTGEPPFRGNHLSDVLWKVLHAAPPSMASLTDREIPQVLETICLRALSKERDDRFESAQSFADQLQSFLDGEQAREERQRAARESLELGLKQRTRYEQVETLLGARRAERDQLKRQIASWASAEDKAPLWAIEEEMEALSIQREERFTGATATLRSALLQDPSLQEATRALAALYWRRHLQAVEEGERSQAAFFEAELRQYDNGAYQALIDHPCELMLSIDPPLLLLEETLLTLEQEILHRYHIERRTIFSGSPRTQRTFSLHRGSYLLRLAAPGHASLAIHFSIQGVGQRHLSLQLPPASSIPSGFQLIQSESGARFAMMERLVTCEEYSRFLNTLPLALGDRRAPRLTNERKPYLERNGEGRFSFPFIDPEGDEWRADWPIFMIDYDDAVSYAAWLSDQLQVPLRLPTQGEWLIAAQGGDQRPYPWGYGFDSSLCRMRESLHGRHQPAPVASYPLDRSSVGIYDVAGNLAQWTSTLQEGTSDVHILMGASFNSMPLLCMFEQNMSAPASQRMVHTGFRLVRPLGEGDDL
ncbi:MAG: SUMF1/EgtB/PvdO family nonheme iron enzyme [Myxococcota bacterium]|nr:SUMF1/EgtB/PvdO family nonheme iron enzyme [Myxococcota bacterium]